LQQLIRFNLRSVFALCGLMIAGMLGIDWSDPAAAQEANARSLSNSPSPYLRLHADDKVVWHEWGEEAFEKARKLNRPLLVSFGYTACHWCHVMQEKHFNDPAISKTINDNFVAVMVDRERRPALDEAYMLVTEILTRRGGWPNTVFMTADRKPFYGISYIPPEQFTELLAAITNAWVTDHAGLVGEADRISGILQTFMTRRVEGRALTGEVMQAAAATLVAKYDPFAGGIGKAPKFFHQPVLMFLLQRAQRDGDQAALEAVETTLKSVASGGIHDHIDGGFHRYAVDPAWRVPHFEKMLYDQAQLAAIYVEAYRVTGNTDYAAVARKTLNYILADLTAPEGGFYATRDADSEGEEGTFYVWSPAELENILSAEERAFVAEKVGVVSDGEFRGKIILNLDAQSEADRPVMAQIIAKLKPVRDHRPKPRRDEKITVSWNALTITAMARAAVVMQDARYRQAAVKAATFIWDNLHQTDGTLARSYFDGAAGIDGELADYAGLADAYINLYDLTADRLWLDRARQLAQTMDRLFADPDAGDYFATIPGHGFARVKSRTDADTRSGNGVALDVLARLSRRIADPELTQRTDKLLAALSGLAAKDNIGGASILAAADRHLRGELGPVQFAGAGRVRVAAIKSDANGRVSFQIQIDDGWHINAQKPLEEYFIPTRLTVSQNGKAISAPITYPDPEVKKLAFNAKPMAVMEGKLAISANVGAEFGPVIGAKLELQVCSDKVCLLPETLTFAVPVVN